MNIHIFLYLIFFLILIEILLFIFVRVFKKEFKWILDKKDETPNFNKNKLNKFYKDSYDPYLGWDRKKNSKGYEISSKKTYFRISKFGFRGIPKFRKSKISVFGDSFAFCRYVNDNQTWQSFLENKIHSNVHNFGVGNYGLDQSFLKYLKHKKKIKSKVIIFNFVPETIARINSYWKHYREFGNILAFKPLLNIKKNKLKILKIKVKKKFSEKRIHKQINFIKRRDIFYKMKFKKYMFKFPYSIIYYRNFTFFSKIFFYLCINKIQNDNKFLNKAITMFFEKNIHESHLMYKDIYFSNRLKTLINYMNNSIKKKNLKMIIVISPQLLDLRSPYINNYIDFFEKLSKKINCLDLTELLINKKNYNRYYLPDIYGGHLNKYGNKLISSEIFKFIKNKKLI